MHRDTLLVELDVHIYLDVMREAGVIVIMYKYIEDPCQWYQSARVALLLREMPQSVDFVIDKLVCASYVYIVRKMLKLLLQCSWLHAK